MATSLSRMMKKAATSVIPIADITRHHRNYTYATTTNEFRTTTRHQFSSFGEKKSNSDESFLRVLESQIDSTQEKFHELAKVPRNFPFKIVDNVMEESIILTREYQGEDIKVIVHGPHPSDEEEEEDQDDQDSDQDEEESDQQYVYLNVSVSKKRGLTLEFIIAAYADVVTINGRLEINNPNASLDYSTFEQPHFLDLNEKLQKAFLTYLKVRGFKPSNGKFLCDYMVQRKHTKNITLLKNLKNFVAVSTSNSTTVPTDLHNISSVAKKSSNSDDTLLSVIKSQIEEKLYEALPEAPREFPFKIEYIINGGEEGSITLTREYQSEEIKIKVHNNSYNPSENSYSLIGSISNRSGLNLKFNVTANSRHGIKIESLDVRNPNDFGSDKDKPYDWIHISALDEKVQNAFLTYLEVRGIEPSITKVLYGCMVKRKLKIYDAWLKDFKNFIAN